MGFHARVSATLPRMPTQRPLGERLDWAAVEDTCTHTAVGLLRPAARGRASTDAEPLYSVSHPPDGDPAISTDLPYGPYESAEHLRQILAWAETSKDPLYFTASIMLKSSTGPRRVRRFVP